MAGTCSEAAQSCIAIKERYDLRQAQIKKREEEKARAAATGGSSGGDPTSEAGGGGGMGNIEPRVKQKCSSTQVKTTSPEGKTIWGPLRQTCWDTLQ